MNIWFCRELKAESFGEKHSQSERIKNERDIDKILRPPFILPHPLACVESGDFERLKKLKKNWTNIDLTLKCC